MTTTSGVSSSSVVDQLQVKTADRKVNKEMGKDQFLELMIAQMKSQNPLNPTDNTAFVAQLAQFSSLEGIQNLNTTMQDVAGRMTSNQALQASSLVGRTVLVEGNQGVFDATQVMKGVADLDASTSDVTVKVYSASGALVRTMSLGSQEEGEMSFSWNGKNDAGVMQEAGVYTIKAQAVIDGKNTDLKTYLPANVDSVSIVAGSELELNLSGLGKRSLSDVKQIGL